jgi:ATP-dependent Zn protease
MKMSHTRESCAAHEAGHAIVATALGMAWSHVIIRGKGGKFYPVPYNKILMIDERTAIAMAGLAGEYLYHGKALPKLTTTLIDQMYATNDYKEAWDDVSWDFDTDDEDYVSKFIQRCTRKAYAILQANRELHLRLTNKLIENGTVKFDEV